MQVFRLTCATNCFGHPTTTLTMIGELSRELAADGLTEDQFAGLIEDLRNDLIEDDVVEWQREDLDCDKANADDGEEVSGEWTNDSRWETSRDQSHVDNDCVRSFVYIGDDGYRSTIAYHIID